MIRRLRSRKGTILIHVLVTAVVSMIIAAGLMRIIMIRYVAVQRVHDGGANRRLAEAALHAVIGAWNADRNNCTTTSLPASLSQTSGTAGGCNCTLVGSGAFSGVVLTAGLAGGSCRLTIQAGS